MTHRYIGTKEVTAWPACNIAGVDGYSVKYADGYVSWSPKATFEESYRTSEPGMEQALTFGDALHYLKLGKKVARAGWNGRGMWLQLVTAWSGAVEGMPPNYKLLPWIGMKTVDDGLVPWLASQTDMLSSDWCVLPDIPTVGSAE